MGIDLRVIYGDTDQMGIVYYANYLRFFEAARGGLIRAQGRSYGELEALGYALPVTEAHVRYRRPARYDDLIHVETFVEQVRGASVRFRYEVTRGEELLADGYTVHACIERDSGRPVALPEELRRLLEAARSL